MEPLHTDDMLLYWIHCNRCFEVYMRKKRIIYLLACQHLSCDKCIKAVDGENSCYVCPMCSKKVRARQLNNGLPQHIKILFHPQPWLDGLPTTDILRFQERHRNSFLRGIQRIWREYQTLYQNCAATRNSAKEKYEQLQSLKYDRKRLEDRLKKVSIMSQRIEQQKSYRLHQQAAQSCRSSTTGESGIVINQLESHGLPHARQPPKASRKPSVARTIQPKSMKANSTISFNEFPHSNVVPFTM